MAYTKGQIDRISVECNIKVINSIENLTGLRCIRIGSGYNTKTVLTINKENIQHLS